MGPVSDGAGAINKQRSDCLLDYCLGCETDRGVGNLISRLIKSVVNFLVDIHNIRHSAVSGLTKHRHHCGMSPTVVKL